MGLFDKLRAIAGAIDTDDGEFYPGADMDAVNSAVIPPAVSAAKDFENSFAAPEGRKYESAERESAPPPAQSEDSIFGSFGVSRRGRRGNAPMSNDINLTFLIPKSLNSAKALAGFLEQGKCVVVMYQNVDYALKEQITSFLAGIIFALHGTLTQVNDTLHLVTPSGVDPKAALEACNFNSVE